MICGPGAGRYFLRVYDGVDVLTSPVMALNAWLAGWDCFGMGSMGRTFRCCEDEGWQ